jgi:gliotoxin/aspirochlorine/mycotoxins biosynthesis cytochrome P450 monooxygenase
MGKYEMLFANLDVTMGGVSWNLVLLAAHSEQQEQLVEEICSHAEDLQAYISSSSTFLAACVFESARLKPLAVFSVPQSAPTDRVLDGFVGPAGTSFIVDSYALNLNEAFWGKDAAAYHPERFLQRTGAAIRYNYWRFGFGPRQCLGKYVADLLIRSLFVCLLRD